MNSNYPYSKPAFSDDEGAISTQRLQDRLWWAAGIGGGMGVVALLFLWAGWGSGPPELLVAGGLCAVFSASVTVRGIDALAELRGRTLIDVM